MDPAVLAEGMMQCTEQDCTVHKAVPIIIYAIVWYLPCVDPHIGSEVWM